MLIPIVGMRFRPPSLAVLANLPAGTPLQMVREPSNEYDSNAIKVVLPQGWQDALSDLVLDEMSQMCQDSGYPLPANIEFMLGYIPKEIAAEMAPGLDAQSIDRIDVVLGSNAEGKYCVDDQAYEAPPEPPIEEDNS